MIKRRQLKWSMIAMLAVCWFIPLMILSVTVFFIVEANINKQLENTIVTSADRVVEICQMKIDDVIVASKASSYISTIKKSYAEYLKDGNEYELNQEVTLFMSQQYRYNTNLNLTALYFTSDPEDIYYCYINNNTVTYSAVQAFKDNAKDIIQKHAPSIDTDVSFMNIGGRVYLIRNIMDSSFHPYAVIVMELNMENILSNLDGVWAFKEGDLFVDGVSLINPQKEDPCYNDFPERIMKKSHYEHNMTQDYVYKKVERNRHFFSYMVYLDSSAIISEMDTIKYVFYLLLVFMIPLIIVVFWFFHSRVNMPIRVLRKAYKEIEKENYGYQINVDTSDEEFYELGNAFNSMSDTLKNQFEKNYLEELALKDANIMALQSQINPHFLNNTLEIINWEARLTGNYKVSNMIGALSTMLEATMDRKKEQLIPLAEEFSYVEAYLYIIGQRFGDNFSVEKEIDESLLSEKVPRLIIQPIVENAVEHGMDIRRRGKIKITIRKENEMLFIEVMDNGHLTGESKEKIDKLLSADNTEETSSLSLGIRNVNKRLKIIYGPECGLTIKSNKENHTVSTIMVKINKEQ
ncbi:MAG: sensor histidine kinase [Lachnospiraceae bacterium]|nr:sensor histidine kinase [Lachnospiraceae bacterium]MBD5455624.1 sensor histidine kinase [Lachnospiraceae bacterium]